MSIIEPSLRPAVGTRGLLSDRALDAIGVADLVALIAVVEHQGFTRAARELHLSQPGISARIARLERALQVRLIDRSVRRLTLTAAGRAFLPVASAIVGDLHAAARVSRTVRGVTLDPTGA